MFATQNALFWAMGPLGLAVFGPLADKIGIRPLFFMSGVVFLGIAVAWSLIPAVRNLEQEPPQQASS